MFNTNYVTKCSVLCANNLLLFYTATQKPFVKQWYRDEKLFTAYFNHVTIFKI